jgi:N-methylhydantoinase A
MLARAVGIDVGGTFIDYAYFDEQTGSLVIEKQPSSPDRLVDELLAGLARLPIETALLDRIFHGTTAGINAVVQERGARVGLITTKGFRDVLALGRGNRPEVYNALYRPPEPIVPRYLRREVTERLARDGSELVPLDLHELDREADDLVRHGVEAIAICFLHSYADPSHERTAAARIRERHPGIAVTSSHEVATEWREFERTSTAVLNAYIQPLLRGYLGRLSAGLEAQGFKGSLALMQSNGGVISAEGAAIRPIRTLESGPAGGVIAAQALAAELGYPNVICADVGGTTYDVALIESGAILETTETKVGGRPIIGPIIDIMSIGAGGGSIAWIDEVGAVRVGPRSAGATPGPACFGFGGTEPTVTDCHLMLGRLDPDNFLGARMKLDAAAASRAVRIGIADHKGLTVEEAANGILAIAETNMVYAIRALTVERGLDPRDFVMFSYGGGGGLFAAFVAQELDIATVVVPRAPANFSAVGILMSDYRSDTALTRVRPFTAATAAEVALDLADLAAQTQSELRTFGFDGRDIELLYRLDMRYRGQDDTITVPLETGWVADPPTLHVEAGPRFVTMHRQLFDYGDDNGALEVVTSRCRGIGRVSRPRWEDWTVTVPAAPRTTRPVYFGAIGSYTDTPVFDRDVLARGQRIVGPAIVEEWTTTIVVPHGWDAAVDRIGNLVLDWQAA